MAQSDEIDLIELWRALWSYRWLWIGIVFVSGVVSVGVALWLPKVYEAEVLLSPASVDPGQQLTASLPGPLRGLVESSVMNPGGMTSSHEALAVLKSDAFTSEFIERHGLIEPLFQDRLEEGDEPPTIGDALELFNEDIRSVSADTRTGLVTMRILWKDRFQAAEWANAMVLDVNERLRTQAIAEAEMSIGFLEAEVAKTTIAELKAAIYRSIEAQINTIVLANVKREYAFKVIDAAMVPDEDRYVRPRRRLIVMFGVVLGGFVALSLIFFLAVLKPATA